jgi:hypothetical protein
LMRSSKVTAAPRAAFPMDYPILVAVIPAGLAGMLS